MPEESNNQTSTTTEEAPVQVGIPTSKELAAGRYLENEVEVSAFDKELEDFSDVVNSGGAEDYFADDLASYNKSERDIVEQQRGLESGKGGAANRAALAAAYGGAVGPARDRSQNLINQHRELLINKSKQLSKLSSDYRQELVSQRQASRDRAYSAGLKYNELKTQENEDVLENLTTFIGSEYELGRVTDDTLFNFSQEDIERFANSSGLDQSVAFNAFVTARDNELDAIRGAAKDIGALEAVNALIRGGDIVGARELIHSVQSEELSTGLATKSTELTNKKLESQIKLQSLEKGEQSQISTALDIEKKKLDLQERLEGNSVEQKVGPQVAQLIESIGDADSKDLLATAIATNISEQAPERLEKLERVQGGVVEILGDTDVDTFLAEVQEKIVNQLPEGTPQYDNAVRMYNSIVDIFLSEEDVSNAIAYETLTNPSSEHYLDSSRPVFQKVGQLNQVKFALTGSGNEKVDLTGKSYTSFLSDNLGGVNEETLSKIDSVDEDSILQDVRGLSNILEQLKPTKITLRNV